MVSRHPSDEGKAAGYRLVGLGATFAAAVVLFMLGGWALDRWLGLTPLFTLAGTAVGAVSGFLKVYLAVQEDINRDRARRAEQRPRP